MRKTTLRERARGMPTRAVLVLLASLLLVGVLAPFGLGATRSRSNGSGSHTVLSRSQCEANKRAGTISFVSPFGYDASVGILDVLVAKSLGYFSDLCLDVQFVASSSDPYALVSSGRAAITGEGSAADDLLEVAHKAPFTAIATYGDTSDYALLTGVKISSLRELEGKTLAYHTTLPVALTEMLHNAGVDLAKVRLVDDSSYDPTLLTQGKFAALQAYQSNEPLTLRADHLPFKEWLPQSFGVKGTFNVQLVNTSYLSAHRQAVRDFLLGELHAFSYCASNARRCIAIEKAAAQSAGVAYDSRHSLSEWNLEVALAKGHTLKGSGVGVQSLAEWTPEYRALLAYKLVSHLPPLRKVLDTEMAASLYKGTTLSWP